MYRLSSLRRHLDSKTSQFPPRERERPIREYERPIREYDRPIREREKPMGQELSVPRSLRPQQKDPEYGGRTYHQDEEDLLQRYSCRSRRLPARHDRDDSGYESSGKKGASTTSEVVGTVFRPINGASSPSQKQSPATTTVAPAPQPPDATQPGGGGGSLTPSTTALHKDSVGSGRGSRNRDPSSEGKREPARDPSKDPFNFINIKRDTSSPNISSHDSTAQTRPTKSNSSNPLVMPRDKQADKPFDSECS
ncbi:uncharacterized protein [Panulirus ornatus]|uniref:uncharacterized protein n=1 Tax=Panulirus ornatus TaxID=150431 RepID=UPI003A8ABDE9